MLRTLLVASPFVIVAIVSCGDSSSSFEDITAGAAGMTSSTSGAANGGSQNQGGSSATAGKTGSAGTSNGTAGNNGSAGKTGTAGNNGSAGKAGTAGNNGAAGSANAGGAGGAPTDMAGAGPGNAGAGGDVNPAQCPNVFGTYDIKSRDGTCGTLNNDAPQMIQGTEVACFAHFVSTPPDGEKGVNGGAALDANGDFAGATLYLDATQRDPCTGTWNANNERLTIKCGGVGDMCTVVLERQ